MKEVNKSNKNIDENLSRISGPFFWNRSTPNKRKPTLEKIFRELTLKAALDEENDYQSTLDAEKLIIKYGTPDHLKVIISIKTKHDKLGQLGKTDKKITDCLYQKYLHSMKVGDAKDTKKTSHKKHLGIRFVTNWINPDYMKDLI